MTTVTEEYPDEAIAKVRSILIDFGSDGLTKIVAIIAAEETEEDRWGGRVWQRLAERMKS